MNGNVAYINPDTLMKQTPTGEKPYYRILVVITDSEFDERQDEIVMA